ncbi:MAG TPA: sulfite exporter TauE/SafE family protein [Puia sp.]|nr:sulfite exporter TauE/SafE family protein [Puia sp.]
MIQAWISAFFLGLLGSLHCVGMCGPLALALPTRELSPTRRALAGVLYHGGRIGIYTLAGVIFGVFGHGVYLAGWQQQFSVLLGVLIVLFAFLHRFHPASARFGTAGFGFLPTLQRAIMRLWNAPGRAKFFVLGMANGLLPCGMVYLAIAGALTRTNVFESAAFMTCFGLGTLPLLLAVQYTGGRLGFPARARLRRAIPLLTIAIGLLLILRGLDLGIPFLSPAMAAAPGKVISCH